MRFLRTNTAVRVTVGPFFDKTDGVTPETALTVTSCKLTLMVDDGNVPTLVLDTNPTASGGANDMVHVTNDDAGFYDLELAAANVNYVGRAMLAITDAATHCPVFHEFMILPANVYDSLVLGTDALDVSTIQFNGSAVTQSGGRPEVNASHFGGTAGTFSSGRPEVNASHLAGAAVGTAAIPQLGIIAQGTAQSATGTTIVLAAATNIPNDIINGGYIYIASGTGAGQSRVIDDFVNATDTATVSPAWTTNPSSDSVYVVYGTPPPSEATVPAVNVTQWKGATAPAMTGDAYAVVNSGTFGNSALKTLIDAIDDYIDTEVAALTTELAKVPKSDSNVSFNATALAAIADGLLNRDMSTGTDSGSSTVRTPRQALRALRNKWAISGGTLTVYKEDDTTASHASTVTGTAGTDPITAVDPAGP